jgi:hypothetical protein
MIGKVILGDHELEPGLYRPVIKIQIFKILQARPNASPSQFKSVEPIIHILADNCTEISRILVG